MGIIIRMPLKQRSRSRASSSPRLRNARNALLSANAAAPANRRGRAIVYSLMNTPMVEVTVQVLNRAASIAVA
jgi:hypothetical protein